MSQRQSYIKDYIKHTKKWPLAIIILCLTTMGFLSCGGGEKNQYESPFSTPPPPVTNPSNPSTSFISVWRLDTDNESITLPLRSGYNYNFNVDWGDGSSNEVTSHDDIDITHTYTKAGDYTLTISGELEAWFFNNSGNKDKIIAIKDLGNTGWTNLEGAFEGCRYLTEVMGGHISRVTNINRMFKGVTSIKNIDFTSWDFALVTEINETFSEVTLPTRVYNTLLHRLYESSPQKSLTLDVGSSKYDSRAKNIRQALKDRGWNIIDGGFSFFVSVWRTSSSNESINLPLPPGYKYNFNVDWGDGSSSEVTSHDDSDITHIYAEAGDHNMTISGTLEAWNFKDYATEHSYKLISVKDLGDVGWKNLQGAFICQNLENLGGGNVSGVTDISFMFDDAYRINPDVSHWDTSNVTNMSFMFYDAHSANPNVSRWDTSKVTDMNNMFSAAEAANPDVSRWDTSNVTDMNNMFSNTYSANPDVSRWDTSKVTDMNNMFSAAEVANPNVSRWDTSKVTDMNNMFSAAEVANPDVSRWDTSNVTNMSNMFSAAKVANPDVSRWDTSNVTNMSSIFYTTKVANPDVSRWDTSNVTNMSSMFSNTYSANPDVSRWDTSNVTNMSSMFSNTYSANPDVSRWDISSVTTMFYMFYNTKVANPDVSRWDISKAISMSSMFSQAQAAQPNMTQWNFHNVTGMGSILQSITLPTDMYSRLLNQIHSTSQKSNIWFHGGNSKYNESAVDARKALIARNWKISDGGLDEEK